MSEPTTTKYLYETASDDANGVRIYTLDNGLKVYLAKNDDAPRIQTYIAVRTGSNNDPADNTGLAHYLEHMMFKGTGKLGTADWHREKPLLEEISNLYEQHKAETDPVRKREIYAQIDQVSQQASQFAIANEYDKALSSLGASGTNAHTWLDETVYKNNIPANELERWLEVEKERFSDLTLRLFHTELETVYEEFNRAQDNDARLVNYELMDALFPTHPNGQQTTLGKAEHLKNPSMVAIHRYFEQYYVPNNYAMILVGDLDFERTIELVDQYFGKLPYRELPKKQQIVESPMTQIVERTVKSPSAARLQLAWRTDSYGTQNARLAEIVVNILSNAGECGLIDLNINQQQKALRAIAYQSSFKHYGYFAMVVMPKNEQSLDEAKLLLLEELDKIKRGDFEAWLIPAIVNDMKVQRMKAYETADGLATALYNSYINGRNWEDELAEISRYEAITKEEVIQFAKEFFIDNYVVIKKETGTNDQLVRVENPGITPIKLNREVQSAFLERFLEQESPEIEPQFIDYDKAISTSEINGRKISFVRNKYNDIAQVHFIFPFGSDHDRELGLATQVLQYLGTDRYSADELKQEFFKLGINHDFRTTPDQLRISITGLEENIHAGLLLLKDWLQNAAPDERVYQENVETILQSREVAKKDKSRVMMALTNFAKYGAFSRFSDVPSKQELRSFSSQAMTDKMRNLLRRPYEIFFYGSDIRSFERHLDSFAEPATLEVPSKRNYPEQSTGGTVYFTEYDMVQTELARVAKLSEVDVSKLGKINVFNEYFGRGLSSIVFQELRESKSLAYSVHVSYSAANEVGLSDYITSYIGTQTDKLSQAVNAMDELLENFPQIQAQFENARTAALKQIASGRVNRTNIFFNYLNLKKLGISHDIRKDLFREIEQLDLAALTEFYENDIKPASYNSASIGNLKDLDQNALAKMGEFRQVTLEEIFGY